MLRARLTRNGPLLVCLGLLAVVLATYAGSLRNEPVSDDWALVVDNQDLGSVVGLRRVWTADVSNASAERSSYYRPFAMFTFWVNVALGGRSAVSLRLGNVLIHAANAVLLALFARRAHRLAWRSAALVALLFAVAPVCSEPVLWISGRFYLLAVTFALLALLASRMDGKTGTALFLAAVSGGLLSKESFIGWLPILLFDDVFVCRAHGRRLVAKYIAVAAITGGYLALRKIIAIPSLEVLTHTGVGTLAESFLFLVGTFLRELVWPTTLDPFRPYVVPSSPTLVMTVAALGALVGAPLARLWRRRDDAMARLAIFGIAWFILATLPSAVVGPTMAMVGDRYAYLPVVGLFLAAAAIVGELEARHARGWLIASAVGTMLAVACSISIALHARSWRNDSALAESSLASDPENPYALYLLGSDAAQRGQLEKADDLLTRAMAHNPGSWRTWNALCYLRLHQDRLAEAEPACKKAIELNVVNPRAWLNLASVHVRAGRWNDALTSADRALALKPNYAEAHYLAGVSAANLGLYPLAAAHVRTGLATEPSNPRLLAFKADLERYQREHPPPPPSSPP
jgi:tetratricopeptide (TPR) repeat protein